MVASASGAGLESLWWSGAPADPNQGFCPQVMDPATGTLVIPDARTDPHWAQHPAWRSLGIRAYVGAPLRYSGKPMGVLSVQSESAHAWWPSEVALVDAMAGLFGKAMSERV